MKFTDLRGQSHEMPDPKAEATQELLGEIYDDLDNALDLIEAVYQTTFSPDHKHETTNPLRAVLTIAKDKVSSAQLKLHDTIAWTPTDRSEA